MKSGKCVVTGGGRMVIDAKETVWLRAALVLDDSSRGYWIDSISYNAPRDSICSTQVEKKCEVSSLLLSSGRGLAWMVIAIANTMIKAL